MIEDALESAIQILPEIDIHQFRAYSNILLPNSSNLSSFCESSATLNENKFPFQLSLSSRQDRCEYRLISDPLALSKSQNERHLMSRKVLGDIFSFFKNEKGFLELIQSCSTYFNTLPTAGDLYTSLLYLSLSLKAQKKLAIYIRPDPVCLATGGWEEAKGWIKTLPFPTQETESLINELKQFAKLTFLGIEGSCLENARIKFYWSLSRPLSLKDLPIKLLREKILSLFLNHIIGDRKIPLHALVFSTGIHLSSGKVQDVKIDVCGHCVQREDHEWISNIEQIPQSIGINPPPIEEIIRTSNGKVGIAFIGLGLNKEEEYRLNTYLYDNSPIYNRLSKDT